MAGEFGPDGTQALPPLSVFPDSLSGPVSGFVDDGPETRPPAIVPPPAVDQRAVQDAVRNALAHDRRRRRPATHLPPPRQPAPVAPAAPARDPQSNTNLAGCIGCFVFLVFGMIILVAIVLGTSR